MTLKICEISCENDLIHVLSNSEAPTGYTYRYSGTPPPQDQNSIKKFKFFIFKIKNLVFLQKNVEDS